MENGRNGFKNHNPRHYPDCMIPVTGGHGGDAILILGPEKTVLYDVGMCCYADRMISNVKNVLESTGRTLDYVILSHSHYDHMGALPYVLKQWPDTVVCASMKTKKVFSSEGAKATIVKMGKNAAALYKVNCINVIVDPLRVDRVLTDGDIIELGNTEDGVQWCIEAYETPGHTDCSMSYMILPEKILLCSESCGVLISPDVIEVSALKSFEQTIEVARRLKKMEFSHLYSLHYGMAPDGFRYEFFDLYIQLAEKQRDFIEDLVRRGTSSEDILKLHQDAFWDDSRNTEQPFEAYRINAESEIKQVICKISLDVQGKECNIKTDVI